MKILRVLALTSISSLALAASAEAATRTAKTSPAAKTAAVVRQVVAPVVRPIDIRAMVAVAAKTSAVLAENAWDFNAPDTIPGFGPIRPSDYAPSAQSVAAATSR